MRQASSGVNGLEVFGEDLCIARRRAAVHI